MSVPIAVVSVLDGRKKFSAGKCRNWQTGMT